MRNLKKVHDFAEKWLDKFRDQRINYVELVNHYMADDCAALGFQMDCGRAFSEKYGGAASKCDELDKIIEDVTDIDLLGSAIYSQWRYFNHWAYDAASILEPENRSWFILALSRLAMGKIPLSFLGSFKRSILSPIGCVMVPVRNRMRKLSSTSPSIQRDEYGFLPTFADRIVMDGMRSPEHRI